MSWPQYIRGRTVHARKGEIGHRFDYTVDFVLIDPDSREGPRLFSRNARNLASVDDRHHGGRRGAGQGAAWARQVLAERGLVPDRLELLTQPRLLGAGFNPVSFWLAWRGDALAAVIAEVNNTFGDRHNYLCAKEDFAAIAPGDRIMAEKVFHVSPFQRIAGSYAFRFDIRPDRLHIVIDFSDGNGGLFADLSGTRQPLTNGLIATSLLRRPAGALRTVALIYWQALRLKFKGATYRPRPSPPEKDLS